MVGLESDMSSTTKEISSRLLCDEGKSETNYRRWNGATWSRAEKVRQRWQKIKHIKEPWGWHVRANVPLWRMDSFDVVCCMFQVVTTESRFVLGFGKVGTILGRFLQCHVHDFLVAPNFKSNYSIFDLHRLCYKQWDIIHSFKTQSDYAYSPQRFYPRGSCDLNKFIPNQVMLLRRYDNSAELVI